MGYDRSYESQTQKIHEHCNKKISKLEKQNAQLVDALESISQCCRADEVYTMPYSTIKSIRSIVKDILLLVDPDGDETLHYKIALEGEGDE